jgi:hypothetical protein
MGVMRNALNITARNPDGKRPLGRPRRKCEDNIRMNITEMGGRRGLDSSDTG